MKRKSAPQIEWEKLAGKLCSCSAKGTCRLGVMKAERKKDRWIGSAQVYVDDLGYARGVVIYEREGVHVAVGPLGAVFPVKERNFKTEMAAKRCIEKELRDAGY